MSHVYDPTIIQNARESQLRTKNRLTAISIVAIIIMIIIAVVVYFVLKDSVLAKGGNGTCSKNSQCPTGAPICNTKTTTCVQCLTTEDCGACQVCNSEFVCENVACP